jgi:hypothetical protein
MDAEVETRRGRGESIVGQGGADHHVLRFSGVRYGDSCALPLSLQDQSGLPHGLEVAVPPLAPFSVVETRLANRVRPDGRWSGDLATKLWIRYDATSPMATDDGRMVVRDPETGTTWTVQLSGSSELAPIR